ncbi:MAG: FAD-dependent oxidoreductase [Acidimicrobiaceae bacterium]|nr:FAD-dependent oxidoreductase [Acidimicrobiaceae bacterium]
MEPTNDQDPNYFHQVVDCQWACPAHTDVPGYIRLIAQGRFDDAYLLNRESNVFPGILGRVCDRPCEPACRRTRVDGNPVAICRLKRVASDLKGDIAAALPSAPDVKNGKRVALVGAGPASLSVANDLVPLGYDVTIFEKYDKAGGLMRVNIPEFRLPSEVLDAETQAIIDMGATIHYNSPVDSMRELLARDFDAVFVGVGAPKGKELELPGRHDDASGHIFIGIEWLKSVAFGHIESIGERVLIIGVGNTAMDCCRTSRRIGGVDVKVMARRPREYFKASPWELDDAEEEDIEITVNHSPKRFVIENGKLLGMEFDVVEWDEGARHSTVRETVIIPCDDVILAIGQENAFDWVERDLGIEFGEWETPVLDEVTLQSTLPHVFFGGDAAFGPKNIIWAVAQAHQAAISIDQFLRGEDVSVRPPVGMTLASQKMGMTEWSYHNEYNPSPRQKMHHVELTKRFAAIDLEVELGFDAEQTAHEVQRCLNCDVQTAFKANLCIECDACIDICPVRCLTITTNGDEADLRTRLNAPSVNPDQAIYVSAPLPQTGRVMVKDENVCVHCGLCAQRCPTAAWDMEKFELDIPYAGQYDILGKSRTDNILSRS